MRKLRKSVYFAAGYNTISLGTGRKEFHPKKPRPGIEYYIDEAGKAVLAQMNDPSQIDEGVVGNFMAARFNRQAHLGSLIPNLHSGLKYLPCTRVEGACASGGLAWVTAMKTVLADLADIVLTFGTEVQNSMKAIYGADVLAGAGHYASHRKKGHAYFFPAQFSDRAGVYFERFGRDQAREAMSLWYVQAIENARRNPKAQEYHNTIEDLLAAATTPPDPKVFVEHLNVYDCSKVSDGASALLVTSEEGLKKVGIEKKDAVELVAYGHASSDLTKPPADYTRLDTTTVAVKMAFDMAGFGLEKIGVLEVHDCFTINGLLMLEAVGYAEHGHAAEVIRAGKTRINGELPTNATGGLIGFGHYTGGTGVRQAVDVLHQLTGKVEPACQVNIDPNKPYGMMISMGGNDKTVVVGIFKRAA